MVELYCHVRPSCRGFAAHDRRLGYARATAGGQRTGSVRTTARSSVRTGADRRRRQGGPRPGDRRHLVGGDARGRRGSATSVSELERRRRLAARARGHRRDAGARRRRQGEHRQTIDDDVLKRQGDRVPLDARRSADGRRALRVQGELDARRRDAPGHLRARGRRGRAGSPAAAVRQADATGASSPTRRSSARSRWPTRSRSRSRPAAGTLSPVDGLRVEAALDARRQLAGAVRVEGDVLDRLDLRRVAAVSLDPRAVGPRQRLGGGVRAPCPASSRALSRIFAVALTIAAGAPSDGLVL